MILTAMILAAWLSFFWFIVKILGPVIGEVLIALIERVEKKNKGAINGLDGLEEAIEIAKGRIVAYAHEDWSNLDKREQAWKDVQATMHGRGREIGETIAVWAVQSAYTHLQKKGVVP